MNTKDNSIIQPIPQDPVTIPRPPGARVLASTKHLAREDWLALRRQGIGSSDAPAVAGLNPWSSPLAVYLDKVGEAPPREPTEAMTLGTRLEAVVADLFAEDTGWRCRRRWAILQHPAHPWMLANLDRQVWTADAGWVPFEAKTTAARHAAAWADGQVPEPVQVQVLHQCAVTAAPYAFVGVLIGGQHFAWTRLEADPAAVRALIALEAQFWTDYVQAHRPPPLDDGPATADLLRALYPISVPGHVDLPAEAADWLRLWRRSRANAQTAETVARDLETRLQAQLGPTEEGWLDGRAVVRWRGYTQRTLDTKALRRDHPDLAQQYTKPVLRRRFTILTEMEDE